MRLNPPVGFTPIDPAHSRTKREARLEPEPAVASTVDTAVSRTDLNRQRVTAPEGTRQTGKLRF